LYAKHIRAKEDARRDNGILCIGDTGDGVNRRIMLQSIKMKLLIGLYAWFQFSVLDFGFSVFAFCSEHSILCIGYPIL
jgi:hypothetical protein